MTILFMESLADKLFISSFVLNKIKDLPLGPISYICINLAMTCLALAYTLQSLTSLSYQEIEPQPHFWNYRHRAFMYNLLGGLTAWTCIFFPQLWLIGSWLFCLNNLLWLFNEYSRLQSPTQYPAMPKNQVAYCDYVGCINLAVFISTLGYTFNLNGIALALNWILTVLGIYFLKQSNNTNLSPEPPADLKFA